MRDCVLTDVLKVRSKKVIDGTPIFDEFLNSDMEMENLYNSSLINNDEYYRKCIESEETADKLGMDFYLNPFWETTNPTVLELGCGNGWLTMKLARYFSRLVAIDINYDFIRIAKNRGSGKARFSTCLVPLQNISEVFKKDSFDFAFAHAILHHCDNLDEAFRNIYDVLKEDSMFLCTGEPIVGKLRKNKTLQGAIDSGLQDKAYTIKDYITAGNKYFKIIPMISKSLVFYPDDQSRVRFSKIRKAIFLVLSKIADSEILWNNRIVKGVYFLAVYLIGGLPVDFVCVKRED